MIRFLFPRLTSGQSRRGRALFDALVAQARQPHWYVEGGVPDTIDGRFALLAAIVALATVRLERGGDPARDASIGLAERFIESMDAEHRQMGLGDPALGKQVRKLVTALGRQVEHWRAAVEGGADWTRTARSSLYRADVSDDALNHSAAALQSLWHRLAALPDESIAHGAIG